MFLLLPNPPRSASSSSSSLLLEVRVRPFYGRTSIPLPLGCYFKTPCPHTHTHSHALVGFVVWFRTVANKKTIPLNDEGREIAGGNPIPKHNDKDDNDEGCTDVNYRRKTKKKHTRKKTSPRNGSKCVRQHTPSLSPSSSSWTTVEKERKKALLNALTIGREVCATVRDVFTLFLQMSLCVCVCWYVFKKKGAACPRRPLQCGHLPSPFGTFVHSCPVCSSVDKNKRRTRRGQMLRRFSGTARALRGGKEWL